MSPDIVHEGGEVSPPTRRQHVTALFSRPEWYLSGYAANIRIRSETVRAFSAGRNVRSVLDIGCGDGALSSPFLDDGCDVTFVDISQEMLEIAQTRVRPDQEKQAKFMLGDISQQAMPVDTFDFVLLVGVLAYWHDMGPLVSRASSLVRPGGALVAECTDASHPIARMNRAYRAATALFKSHRLATDSHSATDVERVFEQQGLRLRRTFRYAYTVPLVSRVASQSATYRAISRVYGDANRGRCQALGSECLMLFEKPPAR